MITSKSNPSKKYKVATFKRKTSKAPITNRGFRLVSPYYSFPMQYQNKMRYAEVFTRSFTGGASTNYAFRANSLYDPNYTDTGNQPLYFDQLTAIYDHFTVISSYIKITVTGGGNVRAAGYIDDDVTFAGSVNAASERPGAKMAFQNLDGNAPIVMTLGWNASRTFPGDPLSKTELQGSASAGPTEESFFVFYFDAPDSTSQTIFVQAELVFNVVWDELKTIALS